MTMSMVAFFHKHMRNHESPSNKRIHLNKQPKCSNVAYWEECPKCEELHRKDTLLHDPVSKLDFCPNCMDAIRVLREAK